MSDKEKHSEPIIPDEEQDTDFPGYPKYPPSEDIYNRGHKEADIDPEDVTKKKEVLPIENKSPNEKAFNDDKSGDDLDIPGAELDDDLEDVGIEDEENNHYSIGGDNHNDLEEDNG
jgi:hypothetical protein